MSHVTDVVLMTALPLYAQNEDVLALVNAGLPADRRLNLVNDHAGGMVLQALVMVGAFNYLDIDVFLAHLRSINWSAAGVDFVQVAMQDEHDQGFTFTELLRHSN